MSSSIKNGSNGSSPRSIRNSFVSAHFPDFLASNSLKPLQAPTAPTFPSWSKLVGGHVTASKPEPKKELFEALIGDARVLFQELLEDPSRFEPGVDELLQEVIGGTKTFAELGRTDRDLLNRATVDFATAKRPTPAKTECAPRPQAGQLPTAARAAMGSFDEEPELEWRESGRHAPVIDIPEGPPTFWWKK